MDKRRSIQVSEECWRVLKRRALDEGVTVKALVEGWALVSMPSAAEMWRRTTHPLTKELKTARNEDTF